MVIRCRLSSRNYVWAEVSCLFFLSFVIAIISDLEYSAYEERDISKFTHDFGYRVVTELLEMGLFGIYYWGFLKRYVFSRHLIGIIVCTIGFIASYHVFNKYMINWAVVHADFVSAELRKRALYRLSQPSIQFPVNYLLASTVFPLMGLAFFVRSLTQDTQIKALKEQQLSLELNYLKAQLHPHFFFNTINNIYALALKQSVDTAPMVARLGEMMRYIMYEADQKTVLISREITFLASYIAVAKIRYQNTIQIEFDVQGVLPDHPIEPLLLLPFIENAFKHGLDQETDRGFVHIVICQTENELTLEVYNSKPSVQKTDEAQGIGLANVSKRLELLYPDNYQLEVKDNSHSYWVTLTLKTS